MLDTPLNCMIINSGPDAMLGHLCQRGNSRMVCLTGCDISYVHSKDTFYFSSFQAHAGFRLFTAEEHLLINCRLLLCLESVCSGTGNRNEHIFKTTTYPSYPSLPSISYLFAMKCHGKKSQFLVIPHGLTPTPPSLVLGMFPAS